MSDMAISLDYSIVCVFLYSSKSSETNIGNLLLTFITRTLII